jgi:hypothetical protein
VISFLRKSALIRYHRATVAQAGLIWAAVLGVTGLIGLTIGGVIADRFLFDLSQFLRSPSFWNSCRRSH